MRSTSAARRRSAAYSAVLCRGSGLHGGATPGAAGGSGAPLGNQNSIGHGAPLRNDNAIKTGEFEAIWLDQLNPVERELYGRIDTEKTAKINEQIRLLDIRLRRMLERRRVCAASIEASDDGLALTEHSTTTAGTNPGETLKRTSLENRLHSIDDAITRTQDAMRKLIDSKHRMEMDGSSSSGDDEDFNGSLFEGGDDVEGDEGD